jgi:hypothetical protein
MRITLLLFTLLMTLQGFAQGIQITEHDGVQQLMSHYKNHHHQINSVKGYRIQIITTDDRLKMENALYKFRNLYPEMNSDWEHKIPYYLVKVGAFKEKLDYQGFLIEIKKDFPGAIPIIADIREEELLVD